MTSISGRGAWPLLRSQDRLVTASYFTPERLCPHNLRVGANQVLDTPGRVVADWFFGGRAIAAGLVTTYGLQVVASTGGGTQTITFPSIASDTIKGVIVIVTDVAQGSGGGKRISKAFFDGTNYGGICGFAKNNNTGTLTGQAGFTDAVVRLPQYGLGSGYDAVATCSLSGNVVSLVWTTTPAAAYQVDVVALYGADLVLQVGTATPPVQSAGEVKVATPFRPDQVLSLANDGAYDSTLRADFNFYMGMAMDGHVTQSLNALTQSGNATSLVRLETRSDGAMAHLLTESGFTRPTTDLGRFLDDGFTVNTDHAADVNVDLGPPLLYMAIYYGGKIMHQALLSEPTSTGNQAYPGLGTYPGSALMLGSRNAWPTVDTGTTASSFGFGGLTPLDQATNPQIFMNAVWDKDAVSTTNTGSKAFSSYGITKEDGTSEAIAVVASFDPDGLTFNWTTAPSIGTAKRFILAMVELDTVTVASTGTLPRMTGAAVLEEQFIATSAATLPKMTGSAVLEEQFIATATGTLPRLTGAAVLEEDFILSVVGSLPNLTGAAVLEEDFILTAAGTLPRMTGAAVLEADYVVTADAQLPRLTGAAVLEEDFILAADAQLPRLTGAAVLESDNVLTASATLPRLAGSAVMEEQFILDAAGTMSQLTCAATLDVSTNENDLSVDAQFPRMAGAATLEEQFILDAAGTLGQLTCEADLTVSIAYELTIDAQLPRLAGAATLEEDFILAIAGTLPRIKVFWTNLTLACPMELPAGADSVAELGGGAQAVALLEGGWDEVAEFSAGSDLVSEQQAGYDEDGDLQGDVC